MTDETVSDADRRQFTREALTQWHDVAGMFQERFTRDAVASWPEEGPYTFKVIEERWEDGDRRRTILRAELIEEPAQG